MEKLFLIVALLGSFWMVMQGGKAIVAQIVLRFHTANPRANDIRNTLGIGSSIRPMAVRKETAVLATPAVDLDVPSFLRRSPRFCQVTAPADATVVDAPEADTTIPETEIVKSRKPNRKPRRAKRQIADFEIIE